MGEWVTKKLSDIGDVRPSNIDKHIHSHELPVLLCNYMDVYANRYIDNRMSFSQGSAKKAEVWKFSLTIGDVILTKDSETPDDIGIPSVVTDKISNIVCGYHLALIKTRTHEFDGVFIMNLLQTQKPKKQFANKCNGITRYGLTIDAIKNCELILPKNRVEQRKISEVILTIDKVIEQTEALIRKYKGVKQGLMQDLLTYGIDKNGNIRSEKTHEFKDSPLGRIPVEWEYTTLEQVTEKIADRDHTTPKYVEHGVPIISPKDFDENDCISFNNCAMISLRDHLINSKKTDIKSGDLIFTRIGAGLGKVCFVDESMPTFSILHSAAQIRANKKISSRLLLHIIKANFFQKQILDGIQSIGVPDLGMDKIKALKIKYPKRSTEQDQITGLLDNIQNNIQIESAYLYKLQSMKRGLMEDLLTGKVSVDSLLPKEAS